MCALCDFGVVPQGWSCDGGTAPVAALPPEDAVRPEAFLPGEAAPVPLVAEAAAAPGIEVTALLASANPGWNGAIGRGGVVTFSFAQNPEAGTAPGSFGSLTVAQMDSARLALNAWAEVSGINFVEVPDRAGGLGTDIRFLKESMSSTTAGFAYYPPNGAISLSASYYATDPMTPGSYGYEVLIHEIGHALGLKHPFEGFSVLPALMDTWQNTVMSYTQTGPTPTGVKPFDVAAISYVYGSQADQPAWATRAGYDAASDSVVMVGDGSAETIWGTSRRSTAYAGGGNDSLLGGSGAEHFFGQEGNDTLSGNDGNDTLLGGTGNDTLEGGFGNDWLAGGTGTNTISDVSGVDTLAVESGRRGTVLVRTTEFTSSIDGGPVPAFRGTVGSGVESTSFRNIENFAFLDGRLVFASSDPAMEVYRFYQAALGRAPDPVGLNKWTADVQAGASLSSVAAGFINSLEFTTRFGTLDDAGFVNRTYQNVLGRGGDAVGFADWMNRLGHGLARQDLIVGFSESSEFKYRIAATLPNGLWDTDENAASAARVYQATLGRHPDEAGLRDWDSRLDAGLSLKGMVLGFTASAEFAARYGSPDNDGFIGLLYHNVLGRAPDSTGFANWKSSLEAGALDRSDVVLGFSESLEFKLATQNWIEGGIVFA